MTWVINRELTMILFIAMLILFSFNVRFVTDNSHSAGNYQKYREVLDLNVKCELKCELICSVVLCSLKVTCILYCCYTLVRALVNTSWVVGNAMMRCVDIELTEW